MIHSRSGSSVTCHISPRRMTGHGGGAKRGKSHPCPSVSTSFQAPRGARPVTDRGCTDRLTARTHPGTRAIRSGRKPCRPPQ
jgi:hypothetical protein